MAKAVTSFSTAAAAAKLQSLVEILQNPEFCQQDRPKKSACVSRAQVLMDCH